MVGLFGPMRTSMMHRLACHLVDERRDRGNFVDVDTSVNEMVHKLCTIMYERSITIVHHLMLKLTRSEQTLAFVTAEDDALEQQRAADMLDPDDNLLDATAKGQLNAEQAVMDGLALQARAEAGRGTVVNALRQTGCALALSVSGRLRTLGRCRTPGRARAPSCPPRPSRARGLRLSIGEAHAEDDGDLCGLGRLLRLRQSRLLTIGNSLKFQAHSS